MTLRSLIVATAILASSSGMALASTYGAIAVGLKNGSEITYGVGSGNTSDEAIEAAVTFCQEDGGKNCAVIDNLSYKDGACGAIAVNNKNRAYYNIRPTRKEAERSALDACIGDDCQILAADCGE